MRGDNTPPLLVRPAGYYPFSLLHRWATFHGHAEMVRLLLAAGADPSAGDEHGKQPLTMSQEAGRTDVEEILRAAIASKR